MNDEQWPAVETTAGGERLALLPQRAVWLPDHSTLLIADAHIGKAGSFRRLGVPVPHGTTGETLGVLSDLLASHGVAHAVFLGDLLHSARGRSARTLAEVEAWRRRHDDVRMTLVRGNHDLRAGDPPASWTIEVVDGPMHLGGLALSHHPDPVPGAYVLAGHVHPAVVVRGRAHEKLRLPCFHFGAQVGMLPAFGAFTGAHVVQPSAEDQVFAIAGDTVRRIHFQK